MPAAQDGYAAIIVFFLYRVVMCLGGAVWYGLAIIFLVRRIFIYSE